MTETEYQALLAMNAARDGNVQSLTLAEEDALLAVTKTDAHLTRAIAALAIARTEVMRAWDVSEDADVDYTLEAIAGEIDGLAAYLLDPCAAAESLGFTG